MALTVKRPNVRRFIAWIESADWIPCCLGVSGILACKYVSWFETMDELFKAESQKLLIHWSKSIDLNAGQYCWYIKPRVA